MPPNGHIYVIGSANTTEQQMAYAGGKAKIRFVVACQRHGKESDLWDGKQVPVPRPQTKHESNTKGCPECAKEKRAASAT